MRRYCSNEQHVYLLVFFLKRIPYIRIYIETSSQHEGLKLFKHFLSFRMFWAKDEPGNLFRIYKSSTKKTTRERERERDMKLLCLAFSSKKRVAGFSVPFHIRNVSCQYVSIAESWVTTVQVFGLKENEWNLQGSCAGFYGLKIGNPQKAKWRQEFFRSCERGSL